MKVLRWICSMVLLICLISLIFKAGSSFINTILVLASLLFILDIVFEYKNHLKN